MGTSPEPDPLSPDGAAAGFRSAGGGPTLAEAARERPVLLVFLRHFG